MEELAIKFKRSKRTIKRWTKLDNNPLPQPRIKQQGVGHLWLKEDVCRWENSMINVD
jgi:hypothetical protein